MYNNMTRFFIFYTSRYFKERNTKSNSFQVSLGHVHRRDDQWPVVLS